MSTPRVPSTALGRSPADWAPAHSSPVSVATAITRKGSRQSHAIIRWLVDADLVSDGYLAYAYFRRLDDVLDEELPARSQRLSFVAEQARLLDRLLAGDRPIGLNLEEQMLAELVARRRPEHGGLESYLRNMMAVMAFDAERRGRLVTTQELDRYTRVLSTAVMDGLTYFIGHRHAYPAGQSRYLAVSAAHVAHMLRDAVDDARSGYYNIPAEVLDAHGITPDDIHTAPYRAWVRARVALARDLFDRGQRYIRGLGCVRSRLAGFAYCAKFESVLGAVERDDYFLRDAYGDRTSPAELAKVGARVIAQALGRSSGRPTARKRQALSR